jgi:hypothetical protein
MVYYGLLNRTEVLMMVNGDDVLLMVNWDDVLRMVKQNWGIDDG